MGLTGAILTATLKLIRIETAQMRQETLAAANFQEAIALCEASSAWTYTVAWIDCVARGRQLGRSLLYRAEHARRDEVAGDPFRVPHRRMRRVPFDFPSASLNRWSVRAFNELIWRRGRIGTAIVDYDPYFYPLDVVAEWNRIYGRPGFVQYQCVVPLASSEAALEALLSRIAASGGGSFLAVLKRLGPEGEGLLSFPMEGYTLALDFPASTKYFNLLLELDRIVEDHGGRLYLAKDARMSAAMLRRSYPRLDRFLEIRRAVDPNGRFSSLLSERLAL
jgi:FAD/FMN-containing dehydrogenase